MGNFYENQPIHSFKSTKFVPCQTKEKEMLFTEVYLRSQFSGSGSETASVEKIFFIILDALP